MSGQGTQGTGHVSTFDTSPIKKPVGGSGAGNGAYVLSNMPGGTIAVLGTPDVGTFPVAVVTDSDTVVWGANITGSSTNTVLAWWNGTHWTVVGK